VKPLAVALLLMAGGPAIAGSPPQGRAAAAPPEIAATIQYSPGGDLVGSWQCYVVELDSRSTRTLELSVRIEDDSYLAIATRRETLSPGARKRAFLYAPAANYPRGVPARWKISDAQGATLLQGSVPGSTRSHVQNAYQVGLYSRIPSAEDDFGIPTSVNGIEVRFGKLSSATFPDRWLGLASLDLLIVHDAAFDELTPDQARALSDYVRRGGTALFSPGTSSGWLAHPVLTALAPVRAGPASPVKTMAGLSAYGEFRGAETFLVQPLLNGTPGLSRRALEVGRDLVRFDAGLGRALVVGVDLRRAPFDTWAGRRGLWTDLLLETPRWFQEERIDFPIASTSQQRQGLFLQISRLINPYPSLGLIFALALVFLVVVGPLNYLYLWKVRRTLLLVLTVPGISLGFLAIIVATGYLLKGTSTVAHSARLMSTRAGVGCAREVQLYSLFSPTTRSYDIAFEPGTYGPSSRGTNWEEPYYAYNARQGTAPTLTYETGAGLTVRGLSSGQWQNWQIETRSIRELGRGIRFTVSGNSVRVANDSPWHIERGIYVQSGAMARAAPFGEVAPGQSADVTIPAFPVPAQGALAFPPASLGDTLLRPWLETLVHPTAGPGAEGVGDAPQRYLVLVLRDGGTPVVPDARLSSRSQTLTLLHVAEGP
jgi:hypothetical protein